MSYDDDLAKVDRATLERVAMAGWRLVATWHRGERTTGRSLNMDIAALDRSLRALHPELDLPPAWHPDT